MAASSEEVMIVKETGGGTQTEIKKNDGEEATANVLRWEKFLPRMVLRVLLVESDDSTRQIITALLRKCSYKGTLLPLTCSRFSSIALLGWLID